MNGGMLEAAYPEKWASRYTHCDEKNSTKSTGTGIRELGVRTPACRRDGYTIVDKLLYSLQFVFSSVK